MEFLAAISVIAFLAAAAQAITGFGFALVLVPLLSLVYDPKAAVIVSLTLGMLSKLPLFLPHARLVRPAVLAPLTLAAFVGIYFGTRLLIYADPSLVRVLIGITVIILCIPLFFDLRWRVKRERLATMLVGLVSGSLTGSTSMGGPPVVLFGVNQNWPRETFRANLLAYFIITNLFTLTLIAQAGVITRDVLLTDAKMIPGLVLGLLVGNTVFHRVPTQVFQRVIVLFVVATGVIGVYSGACDLL